jgi:hypothetical protein
MREPEAAMKRKNEDPLAILHQIDEDQLPLEQEALMVMAMMLDDVENFSALTSSLTDIAQQDKVLGTHILSLLNVLIQGLKQEYLALSNIGLMA